MKSWWKKTKDASKNSFSLSSSISTGHMRGHKRFEIWAFILAIMTCHSLLLELGHLDWDFSGYRWFIKLSLAWPTGGKRSLTITVSTNQSFYYSNFETQIIAFTIESVSSCFLIHYIYTISMSLLQNLMMLRQETGMSFEFCHMFINTLLKLVWKYSLKWFIRVIDDSYLVAFICFVLFCAVCQVIVL